MLKTIKTNKQMRLDELIKYIFENAIKEGKFYTDETEDGDGRCLEVKYGIIWSHNGFDKNDTFTVEIEQPITEDAKFEVLVKVSEIGDVYLERNTSIRKFKTEFTKLIYTNINGSLELVWEKGGEE